MRYHNRRSKILAKMRNHQLGWRLEQLQAVAEGHSVEWRRPGWGGSLVVFSAPGCAGDRVSTIEASHQTCIHQNFVALEAAEALKKESE
jgi:hypothetical protein